MKHLPKILTLFLLLSLPASADELKSPADLPGLICFWDFPDGKDRLTSKGPFQYTLRERRGKIAASNESIFPKRRKHS